VAPGTDFPLPDISPADAGLPATSAADAMIKESLFIARSFSKVKGSSDPATPNEITYSTNERG
jgi:hypothetical protein